jgi:hypothetical protein
MSTDPRPTPDRPEDQPPTSPYGPHRGHVDEAAGGADSSPFEDVPSGQKEKAATGEEQHGGVRRSAYGPQSQAP